MIRALLLIFEPGVTWGKIEEARRGIGFIFFVFLLPLLLLTSAGEFYGLAYWGKRHGFSNQIIQIGVDRALYYAGGQLILSLVAVFIGAAIIRSMSSGFSKGPSYTQSFTLVAYALSPLFLFRLLNALPMVNSWVPWAIGILFTTAALYQGVGRILKPDPPQAFGMYLMSSLTLLMITGLIQLVLYFQIYRVML